MGVRLEKRPMAFGLIEIRYVHGTARFGLLRYSSGDSRESRSIGLTVEFYCRNDGSFPYDRRPSARPTISSSTISPSLLRHRPTDPPRPSPRLTPTRTLRRPRHLRPRSTYRLPHLIHHQSTRHHSPLMIPITSASSTATRYRVRATTTCVTAFRCPCLLARYTLHPLSSCRHRLVTLDYRHPSSGLSFSILLPPMGEAVMPSSKRTRMNLRSQLHDIVISNGVGYRVRFVKVRMDC